MELETVEDAKKLFEESERVSKWSVLVLKLRKIDKFLPNTELTRFVLDRSRDLFLKGEPNESLHSYKYHLSEVIIIDHLKKDLGKYITLFRLVVTLLQEHGILIDIPIVIGRSLAKRLRLKKLKIMREILSCDHVFGRSYSIVNEDKKFCISTTEEDGKFMLYLDFILKMPEIRSTRTPTETFESCHSITHPMIYEWPVIGYIGFVCEELSRSIITYWKEFNSSGEDPYSLHDVIHNLLWRRDLETLEFLLGSPIDYSRNPLLIKYRERVRKEEMKRKEYVPSEESIDELITTQIHEKSEHGKCGYASSSYFIFNEFYIRNMLLSHSGKNDSGTKCVGDYGFEFSPQSMINPSKIITSNQLVDTTNNGRWRRDFSQDRRFKTWFRNALYFGCFDVEVVDLMVYVMDPSELDDRAIKFSSQNGMEEIVRILLKNESSSVSVDPSSSNSYSLRWAARNGHFETFKLLLRHEKVDPCANHNEALRMSARYGHVKIVQLLLSTPKIQESLTESLKHDLIITSACYERYETSSLLLETFGSPAASILWEKLDYYKSLLVSCSLCLEERITELCSSKFHPRLGRISPHKFSILLELVTYQNLKMGELLLTSYSSSSLNNISKSNDFIFRWACSCGHYPIVRFLLENFYPEHVDPSSLKNQAFIFACRWGCTEIVKLLIQNCYNNNNTRMIDPSALQNMALHDAVMGLHWDIVDFLLEKCPCVRDSEIEENTLVLARRYISEKYDNIVRNRMGMSKEIEYNVTGNVVMRRSSSPQQSKSKMLFFRSRRMYDGTYGCWRRRVVYELVYRIRVTEIFDETLVSSDRYRIVKWNFKARDESEMTIRRGQVLHILEQEQNEDGWLVCESDGDRGYVPKNFLREEEEIPKYIENQLERLNESLMIGGITKNKNNAPPRKFHFERYLYAMDTLQNMMYSSPPDYFPFYEQPLRNGCYDSEKFEELFWKHIIPEFDKARRRLKERMKNRIIFVNKREESDGDVRSKKISVKEFVTKRRRRRCDGSFNNCEIVMEKKESCVKEEEEEEGEGEDDQKLYD